ncbi:hypothetical protein PIB30_077096 [Stylosanthes scabra]|uniref:Uncharacterized protein n=1 Tax=Stylosanthes scabra TaxID=79078 RepID=A0ABU6WTL4_9FABA|nr:hypothetical protein [Stylosanthes scabra]
MARLHTSRARAMALARPRGGLGHIRPKLPSSMALPCRPLGAPGPWHLVLSGKVLEGPGARALLMVHPREPIITHFWARIAWHARFLGTAHPRDGVIFVSSSLSISLFFSNFLHSKSLNLTHQHSYIISGYDFACSASPT